MVPAPVAPSFGDWLDSLILMVYAYAGFEAAFLVSGEARDPRHDAPFALAVSIATFHLVRRRLRIVTRVDLMELGQLNHPLLRLILRREELRLVRVARRRRRRSATCAN